MTTKRWVQLVFILSLVGLGIYEGYGIAQSAPGDTISELVWSVSHIPLVPFAFGVVMGHFFWQRKRP